MQKKLNVIHFVCSFRVSQISVITCLDTLRTRISIDQNELLIYNTILKKFCLHIEILPGLTQIFYYHWANGKKLPLCTKSVHSISIEKTGVGLGKSWISEMSINNYTMFCYCFIPFEWTHSIDLHSVEHFQHLYNRAYTNKVTPKFYNCSSLFCMDKHWNEIFNWSVINF